MYFGDFLIQKNIINSDQLLKALCFQIENLPSLIRVVWEQKIFSSEELILILKNQVKDDSDLIKVLRQEKKYDDNKIHELEMIQFEKRVPLGEAVVKLNFAPLETINSALKEYYENKFNLNENSGSKVNSEVEISDAALESLKELGMSLDVAPSGVNAQNFKEKPFIDQFKDVFSDKQKNKLLKLVEILSNELNGSSDISNYFNSLYKDLHLLKGAVALSELYVVEEVIKHWEDKIEKTLTRPNDEIRSWCKLYLPQVVKLINLLWYSRDKILYSKTDEVLLSDENYNHTLSELLEI